MKPVLIAGEIFPPPGSGLSSDAGFVNGAATFIEALAAHDIRVRQVGAGRCEREFPGSTAALDEFSAVVLSDVGALSLLLTAEARAGFPGVNRLEVLRQWVELGGGLMMAGGYTSFQGMDGTARFHRTAVEDCLPVECLPYADGLEAPEGLSPLVVDAAHPVVATLAGPWPKVLGVNMVRTRGDGSLLVAKCDYRGEAFPLLAVRNYGDGRTLAWTTDIGPHWLSRPFLDWPGYRTLATNMIRWVAREI